MIKDIPVWRGVPVTRLTLGTVLTSGRNNHGHITVQHRGGGNSRRFRIVDLRRNLRNIPAMIMRIERDPFVQHLALLYYSNGFILYFSF